MGFGCRGPARRRVMLAFGASVLVLPIRVSAQSGEAGAGECCLSLLYPSSARAMALASAVVARREPTSMFVNPALLAAAEDDEFFVHSLNTSLESANTFTLVIRSEVAGSFALSYRLVDLGKQEAQVGGGAPTGTLAVFDQVLVATYATAVLAGLSAGVSYKLFQFRQDCEGVCGVDSYSATTHGLDAGVQYQPPRFEALTVGASITHLGFALQVQNAPQADPSPARVRVGAAYEVTRHFRPDTLADVWIAAELVENLRSPGGPTLSVGLEAAIENTIFLWTGYATGSGLFSGFGVGVGLRYDRFDVGVAKTFASTPLDEADPFQVTFGVRF